MVGKGKARTGAGQHDEPAVAGEAVVQICAHKTSVKRGKGGFGWGAVGGGRGW